MGRSLFREFPTFANAISEMDVVLNALPKHSPSWTLKETILEPAATSRIHEAARSQPVCTALQIALVTLLKSWGILPAAVVGHSSGEIAAAFAAGRISAAEAIIAAYFRGFAVERLFIPNGAMMVAGVSPETAEDVIRKATLQSLICVACINSPQSVTLSGDRVAVDCLVESLTARKLFARKINTGGIAYHSHHMAVVANLYEHLVNHANQQSLTKVKPVRPVTWVSTVTGEEYSDVPDGAYWRANLEKPVLFANAIRTVLKSDTKYRLIEIGPHAALEMPIRETQKALNDQTPYNSALVRFQDGVWTILRMVGQLYLHGCPVNWTKVSQFDNRRFRVIPNLPPYPWSYENLLWRESRLSSDFRHRRFLRHELLGSMVPAGNGLEKSWRNILKLSDVKWLESHKLNDTIVFPGAGYIAMAVEAKRQVASEEGQTNHVARFTYVLRNVKILTALVVSPQPDAEIELFTTLRPSPISRTSTSNDWWDFTIVSYETGISTTRATGTVSSCAQFMPITSKSKVLTRSLEPSHPRIWYKYLASIGLNFGPAFQSIVMFEVPSRRDSRVTRAQAPFIQDYKDELNQYTIHPITLDAILQATIVASSSGDVQNLTAKVPIAVGEILLQPPDEDPLTCHINTVVRNTGFGVAEADAELASSTGAVIAQLSGLKMVAYNGGVKLSGQAYAERHPMLRVLWKPDLHRLSILSPEHLSAALHQSCASTGKQLNQYTEGLHKVDACLDWMAHKNPSLRVLELGNGDHVLTNNIISLLGGNSAFPRLQAFRSGVISGDGEIHVSVVDITTGIEGSPSDSALSRLPDNDHFDVVLATSSETAAYYIDAHLDLITRHVAPDGGVLITLLGKSSALDGLEKSFHITKSDLSQTEGQLLIAARMTEKSKSMLSDSAAVIMVEREATTLGDAIAEQLSEAIGKPVARTPFDDMSDETVVTGSVVICLLEAKAPLLARSLTQDMQKIKSTNKAAKLVWITSGDLLEGTRPDFGLVYGLSRAVMTEQPSLRWYVFDVDNIELAPRQTAQNILSIFSTEFSSQDDFEFLQQQGVVYISRFAPDDKLNQSFRQRHGSELLLSTLERAKPLQLDIGEAGNLETINFKQVDMPVVLGRGEVQVSVQLVGLNAKDYYVLRGKTETRNATCTNECCGVVERAGPGVTDLVSGDRVVVMAPGYFRTSEIFPAWACQKLLDDESFDKVCTLPLVFSTALYSLRDRANLRPGESVLIHSGAGGLGIAAITVARLLGAGEIFVTTSTDLKRDYLVDIVGLKRENIFSSRDISFLNGVLQATNGRGVDVVLNSLVGDLLHAGWECCSPFGRFVEVGKKDLVDCGNLGMAGFLYSKTFTAFDLSDLYYHPNPARNLEWAKLLQDVLQLFRSGQISEHGCHKIFDVSNIKDALRFFSTPNRIGKVIISLENPKASHVRVKRQRYTTNFSSSKTYIMVGCLGGLGRSLSRWMLSRGARKFVFLGRSGADKPAAQRLIADLECQNATCVVLKGDVTNRADVDAMVAAVEGKVGGVVQAAMGLHEALWSSMSNDAWHRSIQPKLTGTWNLHNAIQGQDDELEFFLMTSSISGSVGTATEANYCAANYFLDIFARYRCSLGLPAKAVGLGMISEVGYLHENPDIEALLLRKGIRAISEEELLQIIDIALSEGRNHQFNQVQPSRLDLAQQAHILTGLEPLGLRELRNQGWEGILPTSHDPRGQIINSVFDIKGTVACKGQSTRVPADLLLAIQDSGSPLEVIIRHVTDRFSNLVLLSPEKVDRDKSLLGYGMDSMIAAEFRSWFYQAFQIDVPFLDIMGAASSIKSLAQTIFEEVQQELPDLVQAR